MHHTEIPATSIGYLIRYPFAPRAGMENLALELLLQRDSDRPALLANLGVQLRSHYERYGDLNILNASVARLRLANVLTPIRHPEKLERLVNLGISLRARFVHLGKLDDLELALAESVLPYLSLLPSP